jgi:hypothetical protein
VFLAQLALAEQPALSVRISGEPGSSDAAAADGALCRVPACEQLNLGRHALFCLEAWIVGRDAPLPSAASVGLAFLLGSEAPNPFPSQQSSGGVLVDGMRVEVRQRRAHQIPDDQGERGGVAGLHVCHLAEAVTPTGGAMLRLSNSIVGLGAQLRHQAYCKDAVRMSRTARLVLLH